MYNEMNHRKVTPEHLKKEACLYIRQSSLKQVIDNHESTLRQYNFKEEAVRLGWKIEQVKVIDCDQGHSGSAKADRDGFQELVAQVSLCKVGMVMGLEVSRLARNNADWHNLLELCAFSNTLILDQDGLYDANSFNDRLLLGLKGAMSEAELHVLKSRLQGGIWNKARRGELRVPLPTGLVYDSRNRVVLDPDKQVQETIRLFFDTFQRTGSACSAMKAFREQGLKIPMRNQRGVQRGELLWAAPTHTNALRILHQPRYAGAFCFGRTKNKIAPDGRRHMTYVQKNDWPIVIKNAHPGYITWEQFERNLQQLKENANASNMAERNVPPREGPALLQGLAICGICGKRMAIHYSSNSGKLVPIYKCQRDRIEYGERVCQSIPGGTIDDAISSLVLKNVNPLSLELAINVQNELQLRLGEADKLRKLDVERARYEAELAQRRFMKVDPENRLVADALEADWNDRLRMLEEARSKYEKQKEKDGIILNEEMQRNIMALSSDFPKLWKSSATSMRDRKRIIKLLIEDVTLKRGESIDAVVRFRGGKSENIQIPIPPKVTELFKTPQIVIDTIDQLLNDYTTDKIAEILNEQKFMPRRAENFTAKSVTVLCWLYSIKSRRARLKEKGYITLEEMAEKLNVSKNTVQIWKRQGMLKSYPYNCKNECLFELPGESSPTKQQGLPFNQREQFQQFSAD